MTRAVALALWFVLAPATALACPGCVSSPYGDRTFGWAYLILYAAPFFIAGAIAGVLAFAFRARHLRPRTMAGPRAARTRPRPAPECPAPRFLPCASRMGTTRRRHESGCHDAPGG